MKAVKYWTGRELNQLRELYRNFSIKECAQRLKVTENQARNAVRNHNIKSGRNGRIVKGNIPHNKGKRVLLSDKCLLTCFKKGNLPANTKHDGCITIRKDKSGNCYQYIRISLKKWEPLHIFNYTMYVGQVKPGNIIVFKNGNTLDASPENLEQITRAEHVKRNANRKKAAATMKQLYHREKLRKKYGLQPITKLGMRVLAG